jgi:hypothetical protein
LAAIERAVHELAMQRENPDLHKTPERFERAANATADQRGNPDAG